MNVTYEHKPAMIFIGFSTSIRPEEGYIMRIVLCVVALLCVGLHSFAALTQMRDGGNKINDLLMLVGSLIALAGVILCFLNSRYDWLIVLIGFGCIAYAAVQNGRRNQNVHLLHHIVRFSLFAVLNIGLFFV